MMYLKVFREVLFLLANGYSDCALARAISIEERINRVQRFIDQFNYEKGYKKDNGWVRMLFPHINDKSNTQFHDLISLADYT